MPCTINSVTTLEGPGSKGNSTGTNMMTVQTRTIVYARKFARDTRDRNKSAVRFRTETSKNTSPNRALFRLEKHGIEPSPKQRSSSERPANTHYNWGNDYYADTRSSTLTYGRTRKNFPEGQLEK